jgi:hypothetical protein
MNPLRNLVWWSCSACQLLVVAALLLAALAEPSARAPILGPALVAGAALQALLMPLGLWAAWPRNLAGRMGDKRFVTGALGLPVVLWAALFWASEAGLWGSIGERPGRSAVADARL